MKLPWPFRRREIEPPIEIKELLYRPGNMKILMEHPVFTLFTEELVNLFYGQNAVNFLNIDVWHKYRGEAFTFTIQRRNGKAPGFVVAELKERITKLEAEIAELRWNKEVLE